MVEEIKDEYGNSIRMLTYDKLLYKDNDIEFIISVEGTFESEKNVVINLLFNYPVTHQIINKISEMIQKLFESTQMVVKVLIRNIHIQENQSRCGVVYDGVSTVAI